MSIYYLICSTCAAKAASAAASLRDSSSRRMSSLRCFSIARNSLRDDDDDKRGYSVSEWNGANMRHRQCAWVQ